MDILKQRLTKEWSVTTKRATNKTAATFIFYGYHSSGTAVTLFNYVVHRGGKGKNGGRFVELYI